ncbi:MAG: LysM peptidoglycan-binding domain-containing protein [Gammaproteobacteria bacterium]|nr:LysM peptidoglycan-binding domain-containing protein [Gammaproteobacteria bacterium]
MFKRLLLAICLGFVIFGSTAAQDFNASGEPALATNPVTPAIRPAERNRLKGVLISDSRRTALIDGRPFQEGDLIGGTEILSIEQRGIRILVGADEIHVTVGGTFVAGPPQKRARTHASAVQQHAVKSGETLSGIALRYRKDGVSIDQMMIALYQSNPQAFSNNINMLHAGAVLRIPAAQDLHRHSAAVASAEVVQHSDTWRPSDSKPPSHAARSAQMYGPVKRGESLSLIASRMHLDGASINQMIVAIYQSNPQAFAGNINVLREGAVLRVPDSVEVGRHTRTTTTAEVMRQTKAWRADVRKHAQARLAQAQIMAATDSLLE